MLSGVLGLMNEGWEYDGETSILSAPKTGTEMHEGVLMTGSLPCLI